MNLMQLDSSKAWRNPVSLQKLSCSNNRQYIVYRDKETEVELELHVYYYDPSEKAKARSQR
jgi:hypothetical protein